MPTEPTFSPDLNDEQIRLIAILNYLEDWEKLVRNAIGSVHDYKAGLVLFQAEAEALPDLRFDQAGPDGEENWLEVPRLSKTPPPSPPDELLEWVLLTNNPKVEPKHHDSIEVPSEDEEGESETLYFSEHLKRAFDDYRVELWEPWSVGETPKRDCIALYESLFHLQQTIENAGTETPMELVWGMAVAVWDAEQHRICHPVLTQQVEILPLEGNMTLRLRPTSREPQIEMDPFLPLEIPELPGFERDARKALEESEFTPSPFDPASFAPVAQRAAGILDTAGRYWPEQPEYEEGTVPNAGSDLVVTDTWVLFARKRSTNFLIDDLKRLEEAIIENGIPGGAPSKIIEQPGGPCPEPPEIPYRGLSMSQSGGEELFFPKPFNHEQVEIIQRLDSLEGVVVQGPPGTGKTHTIANVICHYMAKGKRVLVTSKGEAALAVLQNQIPEQIRNLTVSLLTNEREGKEQLEQTVNQINSKFNTLRLKDLQEQIERDDETIERLHQKIGRIDAELKKWATKNTQKAPDEIGGQSPEDLARSVVAQEEEFGWFPDDLDDLEDHLPALDDETISALREARIALGKDLQYVSFNLPTLDSLQTPAAIASVHQNLCERDDLSKQIDDSNLPRLPSHNEETLAGAEALLQQIREHRQLIEKCNHGWMQNLRRLYLSAEVTDGNNAALNAFEELSAEVKTLEQNLAAFVSTSIDLPADCLQNDKLKEAISRAGEGLRPFGLFSLGSKATKNQFDLIHVDGSRPANKEEWAMVSRYISCLVESGKLSSRWEKLAVSLELPLPSGQLESRGSEMTDITNLATEAKKLALEHDLTIANRIHTLIPAFPPDEISAEDGFLAKLEQSLHIQLRSRSLAKAENTVREVKKLADEYEADLFQRMEHWLASSLGNSNFSPRDIECEWDSFLDELSVLHEKHELFECVWESANQVADCGPANWAELLRTEPANDTGDPLIPSDWRQAWIWSLQKGYLKSIDGRDRILKLNQSRRDAETQLAKTYESVVETRTWHRLIEQLRADNAISRAITAYVQAIRSMTLTGRGKRDAKLRQMAREAMHTACGGVPCWIMPQWRVSESLPAVLGSFDLVIIDEASQSDAWALPALLRGKKVLIVGDDKQVGPQPSFTRQEQIDQIQERLRAAGVPSDIRTRLDPAESVYDFGELVFAGQTIRLREHFRCAEPIIEFSNRLCYDREIKCVRVPNAEERLIPTLVNIHVLDGVRDKKWKTNKPEAEAITDEIAALVDDPAFGNRSIGIVSLLGPDQAKLIHEMVVDRIGQRQFLEHHIRCGDARTFQGSEADVIFISSVDDSESGGVLTQNRLDNVRRINVAVSRARDRLYFVHSFGRDDLSKLDLRARLLDHFDAPLDGVPDTEGRELCESEFELEMFDALIARGYRVIPQVRAGAYRIDMVVEGHHGRRLAIECDGDRYHGPDRWMADMGRQRVLERAGWKFWRCWGSSFARDKEGCLENLVETLKAEEIQPIGTEELDFSEIVEHRTIGAKHGDQLELEDAEPKEDAAPGDALGAPPSPVGEQESSPSLADLIQQSLDREKPAEEPGRTEAASASTNRNTRQAPHSRPRTPGLFDNEVSDLSLFQDRPAERQQPANNSGPRLAVGDLVRYCYVDDEGEEITASIQTHPSNPDLGVVNIETPVAQALLGNRVGDVCLITLPDRQREARILEIDSRH